MLRKDLVVMKDIPGGSRYFFLRQKECSCRMIEMEEKEAVDN